MADSTITLRVVGEGGLSGGGPQAPSAPSAPSAPTAPGSPTAVADATATAVARENRRAQSAAPGGGKSLGGQIGGLAIGMVTHQLFGASVGALGSIPGQRRNANYLGNIGGGAIAGAAAGMALGPIGAGVGAVLGAASGAITAFATEVKNAREAIASLKDNIRSFTLDTGARRQDRAFAMTLSTMGRDQRIEAIAGRADQIRRGEGEMSIENLESWLSKAAKAGKTDTDDYRRKQADLSRQYRRLGALQEMDDDLLFQGLPKRLSASETADSLGRMGGAVGPQVNVADANRELIDLSRQMLQALQTLAHGRADTAGGLEAASGPFAAPLAYAALK